MAGTGKNSAMYATICRQPEDMRRVLAADLSYPIILSAEGHIMDGCHRLAKAALEGVPVQVVQFKVTPPPDRPEGKYCPCGQTVPHDIFHRGPIEPEGVEHHCTCGRIWVGTADPAVLTMKWGSKCKTLKLVPVGTLCSECGINPEPSYGGWCPDCACGAESGCPLKYGQYGTLCPHDWCPHGGLTPEEDEL